MIEVSMITTNWATAMIASAHQRRGSGIDDVMAAVLSGGAERSPGIALDLVGGGATCATATARVSTAGGCECTAAEFMEVALRSARRGSELVMGRGSRTGPRPRHRGWPGRMRRRRPR